MIMHPRDGLTDEQIKVARDAALEYPQGTPDGAWGSGPMAVDHPLLSCQPGSQYAPYWNDPTEFTRAECEEFGWWDTARLGRRNRF